MKTLLTIILTAALAVSAHAAITLNYNNATGAYDISGGDSGAGLSFSGDQAFIWLWNNPAEQLGFESIINGLVTDGQTGTLDGNATTLTGSLSGGGDSMGMTWDTSNNGPLAVTSKSGSIASGLWTEGGGTFIRTPAIALGTSENFTLNVTAVPEPSTYAALFGLAVLGVVAYRRRKA